jgi:hypothetical protein
MCAKHSPAERRFSRSSAEFAGLGLRDTACGDRPVHCKQHRHVVRRWPVGMVTGGVVLVLASGYLWATGRPAPAWPALAASGVLLLLTAWIIAGIRAEAARRNRPVLPLLPRLAPVKVVETLAVSITLNPNGVYQAVAEAATGRLTIAVTLGMADRDRVRSYRRRNRLDLSQVVAFHLGFAVLRGAVRYTSGLGAHDADVLQLDGHAHRFRVLDPDSQLVSEEWRKEHTYEVWQEPATNTIPISLTPSMVQGAGRRGFDLDLEWPARTKGDAHPRLIIDRVERLQLDVPMAWGDIQHVTGNVALGRREADGEQPAVQTITWQHESITAQECHDRRKRFPLRFERPIDPGSVVRGQVEVHFKGTLSRLRGVDLYYPLGHRRADQQAATITTKVIADFELRLAQIRHQDVRVVPDRKREADGCRKESITFQEVVPDHNTIIALTNAISEQGYYVKRVIENPPQVGAHANRVNRYWDIAGRRYRGVYPIDFHLIVTGEELYDGDIRAHAGTTKTTLTVQGAFANPTMEGQVEGVWEQLNHLIAETLITGAGGDRRG